MRKKMVLIDGHSILNRAFFGMPILTTKDGFHTNAIYGFLMILFRLLEEEQPDYLAVAFDVHAPTFRHKMYPEYKGTRKAMAEELREQVPVMKDLLKTMGVLVVEKEGFEADDVIGTLARKAQVEGIQVSILSGDRDLLQLATEDVKVRIPKTKMGRTEIEDYWAEDVKKRYQVTPKEFIDLKALMGDSSDNIPGVPSIGEKTATKIISTYHSIEEAKYHLDELMPKRASKALKEHWDLAVLSKELATIDTDVTLEFQWEEAKRKDFYTKETYEYFKKLQFRNLLKQFSFSSDTKEIRETFHVVREKKEGASVLTQAGKEEKVSLAFHVEPSPLPLFSGELEWKGICVAFGSKAVHYFSFEEEITHLWMREEIKKLSNQVKHLIVFDWKKYLSWIRPEQPKNCFDGLVGAYLLNPLNSQYTVQEIAREFLELEVSTEEADWIRVCYEGYISLHTCPLMLKKLEDKQMLSLFFEVEMPLVFTLFDLEQNGIRVQSSVLKEYSSELGRHIEALEQEIYQEAGESFNLNSPKQLGIVLFEKMGIKGGRKTKTGYSTAADVLEKLAEEYPVVEKILEYRQYTKLKSTYADGLSAYIQEDGRIHGTFNQTITATGRISSTEPNLQNIPVRMELGRMIRKAFVPEEGYVFLDADYSQIELRILAHCAMDQHLIEAYQQEKDIHRATASKVFHIPFEEVTEQQRRNAKAVNFGIVYGISSFGLSQGLSITRKEADAYIKEYFKTYPGIKKFLDTSVEEAKEKGYATTLFGRRRPVPELQSGNFVQRSFGERVAMNAPIQGAAADIMKIAMIGVNQRLRNQGMKSKMVLQVHDELLVEAHKSEVEEVRKILEEEMTGAAKLRVPLVIDMNIGNSWYEAK